MAEKTIVRVGDEATSACETLADELGVTVSEAADKLVLKGWGKYLAEHKWAKANGKVAKPKKPKAEKAAKPKKPKAEKAAKPKKASGKKSAKKASSGKKKAKKPIPVTNGAAPAASRAEAEAARLTGG